MSYEVTPAGSVGGGGSGTGGAGTLVPPPTSGWAWVNQTTAIRTDASDGSGITISKPGQGNTDSMSMLIRPIASSRRVVAAFRHIIAGGYSTGQFPSVGLVMYDNGGGGTDGRLIYTSLALQGSTNVREVLFQNWTSVTSFNSNIRSTGQCGYTDLLWFRLTQPAAAGNRTVEWSLDGEVWISNFMVNVAYNNFCLPTHFGFAVNPFGIDNNQTAGCNIKLVSWNEN